MACAPRTPHPQPTRLAGSPKDLGTQDKNISALQARILNPKIHGTTRYATVYNYTTLFLLYYAIR